MAYYRASIGGGGVTPTSITPSNSSPVLLANGNVYEITNNGGYAIKTYSSKTPDDSTHPSVSSGDIVKMGGSGYLYKTVQSGGGSNVRSGTGTSTGTASSEFTCNTGLTTITKFMAWGLSGQTNQNTAVIIYDSALIGNNLFSSAGIQTGAAAQRPRATVGDNPTAYNSSIKSISGGTVTIKNASNANNVFKGTVYWYAEGT